MPIFVFECPDGHQTEVIVFTRNTPQLRPCPVCGQDAVRLIGAAAIGRSQGPKESAVSKAIRRVRNLPPDV